MFKFVITLMLMLFSVVPAFPAIRTAALCYSLTDVIGADFVGRHYDIAINPTGANLTAVKNGGYGTKCLRYVTASSYRGEEAQIQAFCNQFGYDYDSMFLWTTQDVCVSAIAPAGSPCTGNTTCSMAGSKLEHCGWTSFRTQPDFRYRGVHHYMWWKCKQEMGTAYDGVMEDECTFYYHPLWDYYAPMMCYPFQPSKWVNGNSSHIKGWEGYTHDQIRDSLMYLKQNVWLPALMDSMRANNKMRFPNPAAYGVAGSDVLEDVVLTGSGLLLGEGMHLRPLGGYWNNVAWEAMDVVASSEQGYAIVWCEIMAADSAALGSWKRCLRERLGWYYMKYADNMYLMITGNEVWLRHNDYQAKDSLYKWSPMFEHDLGDPLGDCYYIDDYTLVREFEDGYVYYRPVSGNNYFDARTYQLDEECYPLLDDGTLGSKVYEVSLLNGDAQILIKDEGNPPVIMDIGMNPLLIGVSFVGWLQNNSEFDVIVDVNVYTVCEGNKEFLFGVPDVPLSAGEYSEHRYWKSIPMTKDSNCRFIAECVLQDTGEVINSGEFTVEIK